MRGLMANKQQIVGILIGATCAPLIVIYFERDFMSHLHKSKRFDLMDMFNTS